MGTKPYVYLTCCVDSDAESIGKLKDSAVAVTYATFRRHCDPSECGKLAGYERNKRSGLTLRDDFTVSYFKGTYKGVPAYYVYHSCIEYIWVQKEPAGRLRRDGEKNDYGRKTDEGVPAGRYYPSDLARLHRAELTPDGYDSPAGESGRGDPGWDEPW